MRKNGHSGSAMGEPDWVISRSWDVLCHLSSHMADLLSDVFFLWLVIRG
jgi:hypothetical protein